MKYLIIALSITNLGAVTFTLDEFRDSKFRNHAMIGAFLTEVGWQGASLFLDKYKEKEYWDENGWNCELSISSNPDHFRWKALAGIGFCALIVQITRQARDDSRAINVGCFLWIGGKMIWHIIKSKIKK